MKIFIYYILEEIFIENMLDCVIVVDVFRVIIIMVIVIYVGVEVV